MPRSDGENDFLHTFTSEGEGKSKSTRIAPLEVGRDEAPARLLALDELGSGSIRTPPSGTRLLHFDSAGELVSETGSGTTEEVRGADDLVTLTGSPVPVGSGTSLELEQGQSIQDDTGTSRIRINSGDVGISTADVGSFSTQPTFSTGLAVSDGESIVDGGGTDRLSVASDRTSVRAETGFPFIKATESFTPQIAAPSGLGVDLRDTDGQFTAVSYSTSASPPGELDLGNAEISSDLQLQTGQSIEDSDGTQRLELRPDNTVVKDENGFNVFEASDSFGNKIRASQNADVIVFDTEASVEAISYSTSSTSPGTLSLGNAVLDFQAGLGSTTGDSMTANPESDTEDGFIEVEISGTRFQVPAYTP
jgi:hypothetical protein